MNRRTGLLLVGHGTRLPAGQWAFQEFVQQLAATLPAFLPGRELPPLATAYLELQQPSVPEAVQALVEQGVKHVVVVPLLLLAAGHWHRDLPDLLAAAQAWTPGVDLTLAAAVGPDPAFIRAAADRLQSVGFQPGDGQAGVLWVTRGHRGLQALRDTARLERRLQALLRTPWWTHATLAGEGPSLQQALATCAQWPVRHLYVLPYLWFPGRLTEQVVRTVAAAQSSLPAFIHIAPPLGDHPLIVAKMCARAAALMGSAKIADSAHGV
ncbi:MAG: sirohydrochlorin chelatase [Alicyclobacillus sp.]|nr:sirohydrochlorin chelatase [Alicyclobacillus sp.]